MRVLHVLTTIDRGGAEFQVLGLVKQQINLGYEIGVYPLKGKNQLLDEFEAIGTQVFSKANSRRFVTNLVLLPFISRKYQIIHSHLPHAELATLLCSKENSIATRHFGGKFWPKVPNRLSKLLAQISEWRKQCIVSISPSQHNFLERNEICSPSHMTLIPYGFDSTRFRKRVSPDPDITKLSLLKKSGYKILGAVSRLSPEKNIDLVIRQFLRGFENEDKVILVILGEGEFRKELEKLLIELKGVSRVFLLGNRTNVANYYLIFDVFLHASVFEGFGMVYLEAAFFYLPIITSSNAAAVDLFVQNKCVYFFDYNNFHDSNDFRSTVFEALGTKPELLEKERSNLMKKYSMSSATNQYDQLYKEILES